MQSILSKSIIHIFFVGVTACILIIFILSPLAVAIEPAQAAGSDFVASQKSGLTSRLQQQQTAITPTSILELFSLPPDISVTDLESALPAGGTGQIGAAAVSQPLITSTPSITVNDVGQAFSMDWGDVDRDGDLDLAVGGSEGTAVYLNDGKGNLALRWFDNDDLHKPALGVRWADVINNNTDPELELIVVGGSTPLGQGEIYLYKAPESNSTNPQNYVSTAQLLRVEPGDYNNDNLIDLVVSTNALAPTCPVLLYLNDSTSAPFNNFPATNPPTPSCVSTEATASLSAADYNNDGWLDLALGLHQSKRIRVVKNIGASPWLSATSPTNFVDVDISLAHIPYDMAWGDYDRDGNLDLAAAFPVQQEVRVYRNNNGNSFNPPIIIPAASFLTPLAVDWADFNGDGQLELAVGDLPIKLYQINGTTYIPVFTLTTTAAPRIQEIRGIDVDNDVDLDLALTNQFGASPIFRAYAPFLTPTLMVVDNTDPASDTQSVAWGDFAGSGNYLDLLFGGTSGTDSNSRLYTYATGTGSFATTPTNINAGGKIVAFGDVDGDNDLEIAFSEDQGSTHKYRIFDGPTWSYPSPSITKSLAWGYLNSDDQLDLLIVGGDSDNSIRVFRNQNGTLPDTDNPKWTSSETEPTNQVAWIDFNKDLHLDFAVANGDRVRVYQNNKDYTFSSLTPISTTNARSVAWGDYTGDGWPDLAIGQYGAPNQLCQNQGGGGTFSCSTLDSSSDNTTSVAWGDWENDGDFDLAVGNEGQKDQVYSNIGDSNFVLLWESTEALSTTMVAWGDKDRDGDLDLAISHSQGGGVYENNIILPAHVNSANFTQNMPLPRNPSYVSIERPGDTRDAYFFSSGEVLYNQNVDVTYNLYDPDDNRGTFSPGSPTSDPINKIIYRYSLDGGGTWLTPTQVSVPDDGTTTRPGKPKTFIWNAVTDKAVSDDARLRITIVHQKPAGPVQRASTTAVSPPFRVRGINCVWPDEARIQVKDPAPPTNPKAGDLVTFLGYVLTGTGTLNFFWNFSDVPTTTFQGQQVLHRFDNPATYDVVLTVTQSSCEVPLIVAAKTTVTVDPASLLLTGGDSEGGSPGNAGLGLHFIYLPLILKSGGNNGINPAGLAQVTGLQGSIDSQNGSTHLTWTPTTDSIAGYRIYRGSRVPPTGLQQLSSNPFQVLATVPASAHNYTDPTTACGQMYYITAFNAAGESLPSTGSYFSPPCP